MRICDCCKNSINDGILKCPYCNLEVIPQVGQISESFKTERVEKHLASESYMNSCLYLENSLSKLCIELIEYKWNQSKAGFDHTEKEEVVPFSIRDMFIANENKKIKWLNKKILAHISNEDNQRPITLKYEISGKTYKTTFLLPKHDFGDDFFDIGMTIDKDCKVTIFLGNKEGDKNMFVQSNPQALNLPGPTNKKIQK